MTRRTILLRRTGGDSAISAVAAVAAALAVALPAVPAAAEDLSACAHAAEADPERGLDRALTWERQGGGDTARLCQALALFHKGDFAAAGTRLEELAPILGANDHGAQASLLARAGWAWLRAGDHDRAERLYGEALTLRPDDADLRIDRAIARAEAERYWDAVTDLDTAIRLAPDRADAYLYRAAAHKALSNHRQAIADVGRALELKPGDPEAVLLRGNIKAAAGDLKAAGDDWRLVVRLAPDGAPGRSARVNLDHLAALERANPAPQPPKTQGKATPQPAVPKP